MCKCLNPEHSHNYTITLIFICMHNTELVVQFATATDSVMHDNHIVANIKEKFNVRGHPNITPTKVACQLAK